MNDWRDDIRAANERLHALRSRLQTSPGTTSVRTELRSGEGICAACSLRFEYSNLPIRPPYCFTCGEKLQEGWRASMAAAKLASSLHDAGLGEGPLLEHIKPHNAEQSAAIGVCMTLLDFDPTPRLHDSPQMRPFVILTGSVGRGKTLIASATLRSWIAMGYHGRFVRFSDLLAEMKKTFNTETPEESEFTILNRYATTSMLVIDDLGAEMPTRYAMHRLADLIEARYDAGRRTIITTNYPVSKLGERIGNSIDPVAAHRILDRIADASTKIPFEGESLRQRMKRA